MRFAKLWLGLFALGYAGLAGLFFITLFTPAGHGDITRVGQISDAEFGWRVGVPVLDVTPAASTTPAEADVLVIGDSFSMYQAWQTVLARAGLRIATTHLDYVGPLCPKDFTNWVQRTGFRGRFVIVESVARLLPDRIEKAHECTLMSRPFEIVKVPLAQPKKFDAANQFNWNAELQSGYATWANTRAIKKTQSELVLKHPKFGALVVAAPLPDGCTMFSNALCDKLIYTEHDRVNRQLTAEDAKFLAGFSKKPDSPQLVWMIVPNKSSIYGDVEPNVEFREELRKTQIGPDLYTFGRTAKRKIMDFYWPNDTHLSMPGQLAMGQVMLEWLLRNGASSE